MNPSRLTSCAASAASRLLRAARREPLPTALAVLALLLALHSPGFLAEAPRLARPRVLLTLTALMAASGLLGASGALSRLAEEAVNHAPGPRAALYSSMALIGLASSLVTNDAGLFVAAPLAVEIAGRTGLPVEAAAAMAALGANIGSSLLPTGNPQNLIVWHDYHVGFAEFATRMAPLVALGYLSMGLAAALLPRPRGARLTAPRLAVDRRLLGGGLASIALVVAGGAAGHPVLGAALGLAAAAASWPRSLLAIDPWVLATLALMMADFGYLGRLLAPHVPAWLLSTPLGTYLAALAASQLVSNVPAAAALSLHTPYWAALAYGLDAGGVLLLQGSLANLIALRLTRARPLGVQKWILTAGAPLALAAAALAASPLLH